MGRPLAISENTSNRGVIDNPSYKVRTKTKFDHDDDLTSTPTQPCRTPSQRLGILLPQG